MNVYFDMVGCRVNQAELESLAVEFRARGCGMAESAEAADLVVINTCAVTREAERDSRQMARHARKVNPSARLALTGCWVTREPAQARELAAGGWAIINGEKDHLPEIILGPADPSFPVAPRMRLAGGRRKTREFIKAQDGCNNACAYCVTRIVRGASRSIPADRVVGDILAAEQAGALEAVISGVHLGSWGKDAGARTDWNPYWRRCFHGLPFPEYGFQVWSRGICVPSFSGCGPTRVCARTSTSRCNPVARRLCIGWDETPRRIGLPGWWKMRGAPSRIWPSPAT